MKVKFSLTTSSTEFDSTNYLFATDAHYSGKHHTVHKLGRGGQEYLNKTHGVPLIQLPAFCFPLISRILS